jgi:hypothetical protein
MEMPPASSASFTRFCRSNRMSQYCALGTQQRTMSIRGVSRFRPGPCASVYAYVTQNDDLCLVDGEEEEKRRAR